MTICENEQPLNFRDFYKGNEKSRQVVAVASYKRGRRCFSKVATTQMSSMEKVS